MKYVIESTNWGSDGAALLHRYPFLNEFGFEMCSFKHPIEFSKPTVRIANLKDLMKLVDKFRNVEGVIISSTFDVFNHHKNRWVPVDVPKIEIYDGYRE